MASLTDVVCQWAGLRPEFSAVTALEIEDTVLGGGGFGDNFVCRSLNGAPCPAPGLVVKIFKDDGKGSEKAGWETTQKFQAALGRLDTLRRSRGESPLRDIPGLLAVPQFAFTAKLHGKPVRGYAALRLDTCGYVRFDSFTEADDPNRLQEYQLLSLRDRIQMAGDFVEAFDLLAVMGFVHGDINPQNLFVNIAEKRLAVIDFDSGAVVEQAGDQPGTWGKPGDWLALEITQQLCGKRGSGRVVVNILSDLWSVGVGVHYLLFLFHPLFYLRDLGGNTLKAYVSPGTRGWPHIAANDPLFNAANAPMYGPYIRRVAKLPTSLRNAFARLINRGTLEPNKRPTPQEWQAAFKKAFAPAMIRRFEVDASIILAGKTVTLSWDVENAERLYIDGVGDVTGQTQIRITIRQDTSFTLRVVDANGVVVAQTLPTVRVCYLPNLTMKLPSALPYLRCDISPIGKALRNIKASVSRIILPAELRGRGRSFTRLHRLHKPERIRLPRFLLPRL